MAKIYDRSLSTIIAQGKFKDSFDPRSQTRSGEESSWKGDCLEITRVVHFFFCFYYTFHLLWLFHIRCFVLSSQRKNQMFDTIGILLHHILGEFRHSFDSRSQTRSGEESTWKGDCLEIPRVVDRFFFYYTFDLLWLFHIRCFVLSSQRKNEIFDTIGILLHPWKGPGSVRLLSVSSVDFLAFLAHRHQI